MFSFRTTPLEEQADIVLQKGRLAVLCDSSAWNRQTGKYLFEDIYRSGRLARVFFPSDGIFGDYPCGADGDVDGYGFMGMGGCRFTALGTDGFPFVPEMFSGVDAIIISYSNSGSRYGRMDFLLYALFQMLYHSGIPLSVYLLDRDNPSGHRVEGTVSEGFGRSAGLEGVPHRHGLTTGELASMLYSELVAKFPLHIISHAAYPAMNYPEDRRLPFIGAANLARTGGIAGVPETIGAPWLRPLLESAEFMDEVQDPGCCVRRVAFVPSSGIYASERCYGLQLLRREDLPYHSVDHSLRILRLLCSSASGFIGTGLEETVGDAVMNAYLHGHAGRAALKEHMKVEEQKWIRKAKRHLLYQEHPVRVKSLV